MKETLIHDVTLHSGSHLNDLLTDTLHQTKAELKQLTQLTKQKWGRKALLYQNQLKANEEMLKKRMEKKKSTRRLKDMKKESSEDGDDAYDAFNLYDAGGDLLSARTNLKSDSSLLDEENVQKKKQKPENKLSMMQAITQIQEAAQNVKSQRDYELLNELIESLKEKEQQRMKKANTKSQFTDVFDRTKMLLEELWEEMQVPEEDRQSFGRLAFNAKSIGNCVLIFEEFSRLCRIRTLHHDILTKIEEREVFRKRLHELDTNARNGVTSLILEEVISIIASIRNVSVQLVEGIQKWRETHSCPKIFSWNNENYVMKIKSDLNWLKMSNFSQYFPFALEDNPLLLLHHQRCEEIRKQLVEKPVSKSRLGFYSSNHVNHSNSNHSNLHFSFNNNNTLTDEISTPITPQHVTFSKPRLRSDNDFLDDPKKFINAFLSPLERISKEEEERYQKIDLYIYKEINYSDKLLKFQKKHKAASKIQGLVRTMLAVKEAEEKRKLRDVQLIHQKIMKARMEIEQQQRKEFSRQLKKNSISQLISQLDEETTFVVPSTLMKKIPKKIDEPIYDVKETLFENSFLKDYRKNGRYKAKIFSPDDFL